MKEITFVKIVILAISGAEKIECASAVISINVQNVKKLILLLLARNALMVISLHLTPLDVKSHLKTAMSPLKSKLRMDKN